MSAARVLVVASLVVLAGCRRADAVVGPDPAPSVSAKPRAPDDAHLVCAVHDDCVLSCDRGAVNAAWLARWRKSHPDCKDGCQEEGHAARCDGGRCVALHEDGTLDRGCTEVPLP